jgi:cellobiose phosphorylase
MTVAMNYGFFDDSSKEYVITRPDTPRPWSNYMGNSQFGGVITNNAAGYSFYKSADQGRLTRYRFNAAPADLCGRYVYLRDRASGDYWSNSWMPVIKPLDRFSYECRHGSGYTRIRSEYSGIESEITYFVPQGRNYEVWKVFVRNTETISRNISVFPFIEPQCNWNATDDVKNLQYNQYIAKTSFCDGIIDIASNINMPEEPENFTNKDQKRHTFFGLSGIEPNAFDADLVSFFGPHGNYARPSAVIEGACHNSTAYGDMGCAAFQIDLDLAPGESRVFACIFGIGKAWEEGCIAVRDMGSKEKLDAALAEVKAHWHSRLGTLVANTPDPAFNSMVNMWSPFNNLMTFYWSRTASLVYAGERDGLGFRDTVQDYVGSAALVPDETRERLELMLTGQYSTGGAKAVVQPFKHSPGNEPLPTHYRSDDCMWLFNAAPIFVKETGDVDFYRKVLPFADTGEATVLGHLRRAIEFNLDRSGAHGLPCGLDADWNDCLRLGEKGESVFVAMQLRFALREYIAISKLLDNPKEAAWAEGRLAILDANLEKHAWDGEWYFRAYRFDGMKFGSNENVEGRIFMNPQVWAVLSGHAVGERATQVMESMHAQLSTEYGVMLCAPPYVSTDPQVCLARLFNPGTKENAGIFNHTQGWAVMAAAELGMGDRAWEYLRNVLPSSYNDRAEIRQVEPYVVCQSTHSRFSPRHGAGRISWLSGSAVWNYVAMTSAVLGIQPDYDGLRINPCIPSHWEGFTVTRIFRGATYRIEVKNPHARQKGITKLTVDGREIAGNLIPVVPRGETVQVLALL